MTQAYAKSYSSRFKICDVKGGRYREGHVERQRRMMPLERTGAFTLACVAVLLILGA